MAEQNANVFDPAASELTHAALPESVKLNTHHFLRVLERMQGKAGFHPRGEWPLIPLGMFFGMGQALITSDFRTALGIDGATWKSVAVFFCEATALLTIALFAWWVYHKCTYRRPTPEQMLKQVRDEIDADNARILAALNREP